MIRTPKSHVRALSFAAAALIAIAPMTAWATEDPYAETHISGVAEAETIDAEPSATELPAEEATEPSDDTHSGARSTIAPDSVNEGLEDFELPTEDQLNPVVSDDEFDPSPDPDDNYYDEEPDPTVDPQPDFDLPDEPLEPEDPYDYTPPPVQNEAPRTGETTPVFVFAGISALAAGGVSVTLRKRSDKR